MNELIRLLQTRRSIRRYTDEKLRQEDIDAVLSAGLLSPSGKAVRPWEFIVVQDKETLKKLTEARTGAANMLSEAACAIVVVADTDKTDVWCEDCSITMAYMHLAAHSLGLGSCWIQMRCREAQNGQRSDDFLRGVLGFPANYSAEAILSLGVPAQQRDPYPLPDIGCGKVHFEKY
ncbi:MAG: nitroreductase family protein [Clostridia bacterium]|nr:nitroreductase family protein [Clostridia bacterium]